MGENKSLRIIFMGTPEFAVPTLKALLEAGYDVVAVITPPDKPAGRGLRLQQSDVKKFAIKHGLNVLQPVNLKSPAFINELKTIRADLQVVVAFRMLPEIVWNMPPMGTINLHASLLPQYRGAAPINHAIINGETETGVTTFKLKHEIDTGNILLQEKIPIGKSDNAGTIHDRLKEIGASVVLRTIEGLRNGSLKEVSQNNTSGNSGLKPAPKIHREDGKIDWHKSSAEIINLVRGLSPYPGAFTFLNNKRILIMEVAADQSGEKINPGEYQTDYKSYLRFATGDGVVKILRLKPEGKREMSIEDFLRGHKDF